jgi:hypothetical protein
MKSLPNLAATVALCAGLSVGSAWAATIDTTPPAAFKKVSTLVKLPDFLPGLGTLYVDPSTLPVGPFLGYDRSGKLVNVTYMVPLKQLEEHKAMNDLGTAAKGVKVDHTDMYYNAGHPGVEEPHYHIVQWLISKDEQTKSMK